MDRERPDTFIRIHNPSKRPGTRLHRPRWNQPPLRRHLRRLPFRWWTLELTNPYLTLRWIPSRTTRSVTSAPFLAKRSTTNRSPGRATTMPTTIRPVVRSTSAFKTALIRNPLPTRPPDLPIQPCLPLLPQEGFAERSFPPRAVDFDASPAVRPPEVAKSSSTHCVLSPHRAPIARNRDLSLADLTGSILAFPHGTEGTFPRPSVPPFFLHRRLPTFGFYVGRNPAHSVRRRR